MLSRADQAGPRITLFLGSGDVNSQMQRGNWLVCVFCFDLQPSSQSSRRLQMLVALIPPLPRAAEACTIGVSHKQRGYLQSHEVGFAIYSRKIITIQAGRRFLTFLTCSAKENPSFIIPCSMSHY